MATMLVVESNAALGQEYLQLFEETGLYMAHTTTYQQTISCIERSFMPDLILLDMAIQDGLALIHYIQSKLDCASTQLIILTENDNFYAFAEDLQIEHVFHKSTPFPTLLRYISHLLLDGCNT